MKSIRTVLATTVLACTGMLVALAQMPSGNRVNNPETIAWTGTATNLTLAQTTQPVVPQAVELTFKTAGTTDFNFSYVRAGYTNVVISRTITNCITYIWSSPRDIKLITADKLQFTKSRGDDAQLTIHWK